MIGEYHPMTEIATEGQAISVTSKDKIAKFANHLAQRATVEESEIDGQEIASGIAVNILNAKDLDGVFGAAEQGLLGGRDLVGVEQRIMSYEIRKADDPEKQNELVGNTFLVVHSIRIADGIPFDWNTSATTLVTMIFKFDQLNALPLDVVIVQKGNSNALAFRRIANRAI
jgi:hypothetical protein